jgi:hypothetical protein
MSPRNKNAQLALLRTMIAGILAHFSTVKELTFGGASHAPPAVAQTFQDLLDLDAAFVTAKTKAHDALVAKRAKVLAVRVLLKQLTQWLLATYTDASFLADFGLVPRKTATPLKAQALVTKVARNRATRTARHTMGKKQKKDIKGSVAQPANSGPADAPAKPSNGA